MGNIVDQFIQSRESVTEKFYLSVYRTNRMRNSQINEFDWIVSTSSITTFNRSTFHPSEYVYMRTFICIGSKGTRFI